MGTSTRVSPASLISRSAASSTLSPTADATTAAPRSTDTATRLPRTSCWPRPASQPSTRGSEKGSYSSLPLQASNQRAVSRTERDRHPRTAVSGSISVFGPFGIRPNVDLRPKRPVKPAGIRMEPPPSPPVQIGRSPPATDAAEPPEEPPGVRSRS